MEIKINYRSFKPTKWGYRKAISQCSEAVQAEHKECSKILWKDMITQKWASRIDYNIKSHTSKSGNKATSFIVANGQLFVHTSGWVSLFQTGMNQQNLQKYYWRIELKEDASGEAGELNVIENLGDDGYFPHMMRHHKEAGHILTKKHNLFQLGIARECGLDH